LLYLSPKQRHRKCAIYRGEGGAGDATADASNAAALADSFADAANASAGQAATSASAALAAQIAAELAETNAETAETNAEAAEAAAVVAKNAAEAVLLDTGFIAVSADLQGDDNIGTVADDIANVNAVGSNIAAVIAVDANEANINIVAADGTDIGTVATSIADVNSVATNILDVTAVADNETNIDAVAANATNINTVAGISGNVTTVAGISANVTTVATNNANVTTVATDITNVNAVGTNIANVNSVAGNATNINAVNSNATNINTVAGISGNVTTVAGISADVTAVAGIDQTDLADVAAIDSDVATVAGISGNVTTVAGISANVTSVAGNSTNINTVATDIANVNTVGTNIANVNTTATNIANVNTVAGISANVTTVAGISGNVTTVATNNANVTTVAGSIANVNTVGGNIANVNQVAADTVVINSASANATAAAASATAADVSATSASASAAAASAVALGNEPVRHSVRPSLLLDFANTKQLDPRITFTRGSTASFYDGRTVAKAEENLLIRSAEFDNATWQKANTTVAANSTAAPDGTTTAETLTANASTSTHDIFPTALTSISGVSYVASIVVKKNTNDFFQICLANQFSEFANFNINTGVVGTTGGTVTSSISNLGNGWFRCVMVYTASVTNAFPIFAIVSSSSATRRESWTAAGTESVYIWGAQLEQRSSVTAYTATTTAPITNYIPALQTAASGVARFEHNPVTGESLGLEIEEQRTNLLLRSDDFNNTWGKTRATITVDTVISPDGTLNADKLVEDTTATNTHQISQTPSLIAGTAYTMSVYAKAGERTRVQLGTANISNWAASVFTTFDLSAGTVASGAGTITSVGNGWYRCSITATFGASNNSGGLSILLVSTGTTVSYTGDGYSGLYIWGAQLEAGAFDTSYIPTVASQVTRSADAASMTGTNFSSWYRADEGTIYTEASLFGSSVNRELLAITDNTTNNNISFRWASGSQAQFLVNANGTLQASIAPSGYSTVGQFYKRVGVYKVNDFQQAIDGTSVGTDTLGLVPVLDRLYIGASTIGASAYSGTIKKISFYPLRLTSAQLSGITTV
jgi:hypothetical protein